MADEQKKEILTGNILAEANDAAMSGHFENFSLPSSVMADVEKIYPNLWGKIDPASVGDY